MLSHVELTLVLKNEQHLNMIRTWTTRCLYVRVNVGIQKIANIFKERYAIVAAQGLYSKHFSFFVTNEWPNTLECFHLQAFPV